MDSGDEAEFAILEGDGDDEDYAHGDDSSISEYEPGAEEHAPEDDAMSSDGIGRDERLDDEAAFLTGASAGETDAEGGVDSDGASDLFDEGFDYQAALQQMDGGQEGGRAALQPYQVLASRRRAAASDPTRTTRAAKAAKPKGQSVHGVDVDEIAAMDGMDGRVRRRRSKKPPGGQRKRVMSQEAEELLGQANLLYATNKNKEAIELCQEVIRLAPNAADAYHTIGTIQEAMGNPRKALDFYMIAAHLPPKDMDLWRRLASMSTEQGFLRQAIYCLNKVLFSERGDLHAQWDRAVLYSDVNEPRKAIKAFETIRTARPGDGEVVKVLSRLHYRVKDIVKARQVLERHLNDHPEAVDLTHVNILAELYMEVSDWDAAARLIDTTATDLCAEAGLPVDLQVKAGVCAMRRGNAGAAERCFGALAGADAAEYGDLLLEVAELWLSVDRPANALPLLQVVRQGGSELDGPAVWTQLAECLQAVGDADGAIAMYQDVLSGLEEGTAEFMEATLALADLLCVVGAADAATQLLLRKDPLQEANQEKQGPEPFPLLMRRAQLLLQLGQDRAFVNAVMPVVSATVRHFEAGQAGHQKLDPAVRKALRRRARRKQEATAVRPPGEAAEQDTMFKGFTTRDRRKPHIVKADEEADAIAAQLTDAETEGEDEDASVILADVIKDGEQFQLLVATGRALVRQGEPDEARALCDACLALFAKRWTDKSRRDRMRAVAAEAALASGDPAAALAHLKPVAQRWPHSCTVWATFARILGAMGAILHTSKFIRLQRHKHPTSVPLMMLLGHCNCSQGTYAEALGQYFHAYRQLPTEPLVLLCLGVTFANQAMTKKVGDRHWAVLQAFAFLREYGALRGCAQEAAYNMARAAQQLGLMHLAVPLYERALATEPETPGADVRREAAHNLALIYRRSGSEQLARKVLRAHFTV